MYETGKLAQVAIEMERNRLHILGVSETRWIQSGTKHLKSGELFLYSGRDDRTHAEGVGILLSKIAKKTLRGWEAHGSRVIMASFNTRNRKINMNIVQIYAPTNEAEDEKKEDFYNKLQDIIDRLPKKDLNIIMGDANAKIGGENSGYEEIMGVHGLGTMNENGERFANMCAFNSLVIGGSVFPHKKIHKATWVSPDRNTENQIDHFCISRRFRRSLEDVRVLRSADVGSDHHLLMAKVKLRLRKYMNHNESKRLKFQASILQSKEKKEDFQLELRNRFLPLTDLGKDDVQTHWSKVKEVFTSACHKVLGEKKYHHKDWISKESLDLIEDRRSKKAAMNESRTRGAKETAQADHAEAARKVKASVRKDKELFMNELAEKAEKAATEGHMRTLHQTAKILSGKRVSSEMPVKDKDGKTIFGKEEQMKRWTEHFSNLLNRSPPENPPDILPARNDLSINCEPPTKEEIVKAVKQLNSGKAAGPDFIPPEALKADANTTADILHQLFVKIWNEGQFPTDWNEGHVVKLPKKGDLSNCNNYRGITLLSIPAKVFNRIILERIKRTTDEKLRDEQAGFRKNRATTDQIATLRIIMEQSLEWNSPLIVNFIDYEKAFDSVDRTTMWKIMRHYGIPEEMVNLIAKMYEGTSCSVLHEGQLTESFEVKTGVRQGCLLSPFLFILAIDWLMKETTSGRRNGIQWTPWTQLDDLDFADDLALLSHTTRQMQAKTTELNTLSGSIGLNIHPEKSKVLKVNSPGREAIVIEGKTLEEVESFVYLGSIMDKKGGTEADIKSRIGKARSAFTSLNKIWKDRQISLRTKLRLYNSNVKAILLYGCETWNTSQTCMKKLQTFVNRCLRKILKIRWTDRIKNEEVWEKTEQELICAEIGRRRWRWIGHTLRKPTSSITKKALDWNPQGARKRGRPRTTWKRSITSDLQQASLTWAETKKIAQDRDRWKGFVRGLYPARVDRQ